MPFLCGSCDAVMVYVTDITGSTTAKTAAITATGFYFYNATTSKWAAVTPVGASLQLNVTKNSAQTTAIGATSASPLPDVIAFQSSNTGTLTGGNTWDICFPKLQPY